MSHIVVIVHRDRWSWPKLTITVEGRFKTPAAADRFITRQLRAQFERRRGKHWSRWNTMRIHDYRIVDAEGLTRLRAAAKASVTIRRKRAAVKAAATRWRNERPGGCKCPTSKRDNRRCPVHGVTLQETMLLESKSDYYPAH